MWTCETSYRTLVYHYKIFDITTENLCIYTFLPCYQQQLSQTLIWR